MIVAVISRSDSNNEAVMAGLVPAIHALMCGEKDVDARHKAGHDDAVRCVP
jgi:hypothetical protein